MLRKLFSYYSTRARAKRTRIFKSFFSVTDDTKILDLGGGDGNMMISMGLNKKNIFVADFDKDALAKATQNGLNIVQLDESGKIPCAKNEYDIIFSNSVIEHVTVDKEDVYKIKTNKEFRAAAWERQKYFASEIQDKCDKYYVQTPYKYFIIESHSWLPIIIVLVPRKVQIAMIRFFNKFWPKQTSPDWNLLTVKDMQLLFPGAKIIKEKSFFMTKSLIAVKA
jgi:SAM-dependent methyltransferase